MPYDAGSAVATLSTRVDLGGFDRFDKRLESARVRADRGVTAKLQADVDARGFDRFDRMVSSADRSARIATPSIEGLAGGLRKLFDTTAKIGALGLAAQGVAALGAAGGAAAAGLAPLGGLLAAYPALATAAGQGLGVFKLATANVFGAVGGLNQQLDKNSKAYKELDPQAQRLAQRLESMKKPLRDLSGVAQRGLFPGLESGIESLSKLMPVVRGIVRSTAAALGDLASQAGRLVSSWGPDLETQGRRNVRWMREGGDAALHLLDATRHLTLAAGPLVDWMVKGADSLARLIDRETEAGRKSGALAAFFEQTRIQAGRLIRIAEDLGAAFINIGKAAYPVGDGILKRLTAATNKFREWTDSARGQNTIAQYFRDAQPAIDELGRLIVDITKAFFQLGRGDQVAPLLRTVRTELLPAITQMIDSTTKQFMPAFLTFATESIKLFTKLGGTSGPLVQLTVLMGKIVGAVNRLLDQFPLLNSALVTLFAFGGIAKALRIGAAITGVQTLIGWLTKARGVAATVAVAEAGAAGAGGAAAARGAAGGAAGASILSRIPGPAKILTIVAGATVGLAAHARAEQSAEGAERSDRFLKVIRDIATSSKSLPEAEGRLRAFEKQLRSIAAMHPDNKDWVRYYGGIADAADDAADKIHHSFHSVEGAIDDARGRFADFRRTGSNDMKGIRFVVAENTQDIKERLGRDTAAGKEALAKNFRLAAHAVRKAMDDGKISVNDGLAEIQRLMRRELAAYGITGGVATSILRHGDIKAGGGAGAGKYGGGWIGGPGMVGADTVPAMLAPGEAVLNRHQQAVIESLLGGGFLNRLFATVRTPHYMAGGGRVTGDTDFVPAMMRALTRMSGATGTPIYVVSGRRTRAEQQALIDRYGANNPAHPVAGLNGPHVQGIAADIQPGRARFGGIAGRFGLGFTVGNEPWHVQLLNAAAAAAMSRIRAPQVRGTGALAGIVRGALGRAASGANYTIDRALAALGGTNVPGGGAIDFAGAGGSNRDTGRRLMRAFGFPASQFGPLDRLWTGESGWNERARNRSSGAYGIPQALPGSKMASAGADWMTNAATQIRWGLGYIRDRYGTPARAYSAWLNRNPHWYARGGFARGGWTWGSPTLPWFKLQRGWTETGFTGKRTFGTQHPGFPQQGDPAQTAYDRWTQFQENVDAQVRAGVMSVADATSQETSFGRLLLAGNWGPLTQVERWDVMGDLRELAATTGSPSTDPELQAQLAQANQRAVTASERARIAEASLSVLGSPAGLHPAAIGMAPPSIIFQSYVPPSPQQANDLGRYVTKGLGYQGLRQASRVDLGA